MTTFTDLDGLADRVRSDSTVAIGGALLSRLPIALIRAVLTRRPRRLHYVAWGGGLPLEMFLEAGAVSRLSFCFSSLDVFGLAPRFRAALEADAVAVQEWTALGMIQALRAAGEHLPSATLQVPYATSVGPQRRVQDHVSGEDVAAVPALPIGTLLLHATRADTDGNIEIQGTRGLDLSLIPAASEVLVTVEEIVPRGMLGAPKAQIVPRRLVTAVAKVPGGAFPTSSLPHYAADYRGIARVADDPLGDRQDRDERRALFARATRLGIDEVRAAMPVPVADDRGADVAELMMTNLAAMYEPGAVLSAGAVSPLALGSYLLALHRCTPKPTLLTTSGSYIDIAPRPLLLGLGEVLDFASAPIHMGSDESYHQYYQPGRVDFEVVNVAQVDATGATNNLWVTSPSGRRIRLPGQGGMADVADMHANFVVYQPRQSALTLVDTVARVSAARALHTAEERQRLGYRPGRTRVVTNLAVLERSPGLGRLEAVSLHPGVTDDVLREATGFRLDRPTSHITDVPDSETLRILRCQVDPLGMRYLEFASGKERTGALDAVIAAEERIIESAAG